MVLIDYYSEQDDEVAECNFADLPRVVVAYVQLISCAARQLAT